jgi:hypothetical protein
MSNHPFRLCIIGNSHVGALKEAWDQIEGEYPDVEVTFFAARGTGLADLDPWEGVLRPGGEDAARLARFLRFTSQGRDHIAGDAYDLFLVYGAPLPYGNLPKTYSTSVLRACVRDWHQQSMYPDLIAKLQSITSRPIRLAPAPLRSAWANRGEPYPYAVFAGFFAEICKASGIGFVGQPAETRDAHNRSLPQFATRSKRLDVGRGAPRHEGDDVTHMNADYGRVWLTHFLASLSEVTRPERAEL